LPTIRGVGLLRKEIPSRCHVAAADFASTYNFPLSNNKKEKRTPDTRID
jgi:hypothetical protein